MPTPMVPAPTTPTVCTMAALLHPSAPRKKATMVDRPSVTVRREGKILVITLDRPAKRNAMDGAMARGLAAAVDELDADPSLVVGVLTGAGGTFCAGMDLAAFLSGDVPDVPGRGLGGITRT